MRPVYKYWVSEEGLKALEGFVRGGLTDVEIAERCGVSVPTLQGWKRKYTEIAAAFACSTEAVDMRVEDALLRSAIGYTAKVKVPIKLKRSHLEGKVKVEEEFVEVVEQEVYQKPSLPAQIHWLKHRRPAHWGTGQGGGELDVRIVDDLVGDEGDGTGLDAGSSPE